MNLALPRKRGTLAGGRSAWSAALSGSRPVRVPPLGGFVVDHAARFMVPMRINLLDIAALHEPGRDRFHSVCDSAQQTMNGFFVVAHWRAPFIVGSSRPDWGNNDATF